MTCSVGRYIISHKKPAIYPERATMTIHSSYFVDNVATKHIFFDQRLQF